MFRINFNITFVGFRVISLILIMNVIGVSYSQTIITPNIAKELELYIIKENVTISKSTDLVKKEGVYFASNGCFTVEKDITLTISSKLNIFQNRQLFFGEGNVLFNSGAVSEIDITWFGAIPNDTISDVNAIQKAIDAAIHSKGVSVVYFPPGEYIIDSPLLALNIRKYKRKTAYVYLNLTLRGHQLPFNNGKDGKGGVSVLKVNKEIPFALGIQGARGVYIKDLVFDGFIKDEFKIEDLINQPSNQLYQQKRYTPLCAIVIDPFSPTLPDEKDYYAGLKKYYNNSLSSWRIQIEGTVFQNFPTGIAISPNGKTQQGDSVSITFCRFDNLINGLVICQTQSRNIVLDKCDFRRMKFVINSEDFGEMNGVLPEVNNTKISGGVAWIFKANGNVAYGHFKNVYAEALYGIGYSRVNKQPLHFESCSFNFRPMTSLLKNDYNPCILKSGNASFNGCTLLMGGGKNNIEPILFDVSNVTYTNCYLDSFPVNIGDDLKNKNKSTNINSRLRTNKRKTSSWEKLELNKESKIMVNYDIQANDYSLKNISNYSVGDYIFGNVVLQKVPFIGKSMYTAIGRVYKVENDKAFFKSTLLENKSKYLKIIDQ